MAFSIYHILFGCLLVLFIYLWRISHTFRYYMKYAYYYTDIQLAAFLVLFPALFRPGNPANIRYFQYWCHYTFKVLGIKLEKRNTSAIEDLSQPAIILVNHQNTVDVIGIMAVTPYKASFLAKHALKFAGYFGVTAMLSGLIFIDRLNPEKAKNTMKSVVKTLHQKNIKLWIFPEGTRNLNGEMLPFKKGAFHLAVQAQVPIYPVVQSSYQHFLDPKRKIFNTGKVIVSGLPCVETKGLTADDVNDLTERVHSAMEAEFKKISREVEAEARASGHTILAD